MDLMENIDESLVLDPVKKLLEILEAEEQSVSVDESYALEIKEYLLLLNMTEEIDLFHFPNVGDREKITIISQPGIRFAQAEALIESLLQDEKFESLSAFDRSRIETRILDTIRGRMMEDIVLLETKISKPDRKVFKLQFAVGEFDMVVCDEKNLTCEIYEVEHSKEAVKDQYRFLSDSEYCAMTEHRFGRIIGKYVIYRGEKKETDGIRYLNVEEYLKNL